MLFTSTLGRHPVIAELLEAAARFAAWVVVDMVLDRVMYPVGSLLLKCITFGRYPGYRTSDNARLLISIFPFVVLLVGVTLWHL